MEYFKHDINASEDDKICDLLANGGYEMLGYYWRFVEYLYNRGGYAYKNKLNSIAWALHMDVEKLNALIYEYDLFESDEDKVYSKRALNEIEEFEAVGKRMSEIGKKGGKSRANKAENDENSSDSQACANRALKHTLTDSLSDSQACAQQKKIEENKKEENKENKIDIKEERSEAAQPPHSHTAETPLRGFYKNVRLTDEEFEAIKQRFPNDWGARIDRLSKYMADSKKTYASHYDTMIRWGEQDEANKSGGKQKQQYGNFDTDEFWEAAFKKSQRYCEEHKGE